MRRAQVYYDTQTGEVSVVPGWPPTPKKGDHWVKPATKTAVGRTKHLERKVTEVKGWRLTYEDQSGQVRECSTDAFRKWTDDCRAVPKKLRDYVVKQTVCLDCDGKKLVESYSGKKICSCWRCDGTGQMTTVEAKRSKKRGAAKKKARR